MKKWLSLILAAVMLTAICVTACISLVATASGRTLVVQVTNAQKNAASQNVDGFVAYFPNDTDAVKTITSGQEVALRYINFLVFDGEGKLVAVGNNLFTPAQAAGGSNKTTVDVPAHGTLVTFDYFATNRVQNQKLWDIYNAALGMDDAGKQIAIYNDVKEVTANYYMEIDNETTLSFYDGPAPNVVTPDLQKIIDAPGTGTTDGWADKVLIENKKCKESAMQAELIREVPDGKLSSVTLSLYYNASVMIGYPEGKATVLTSTDGTTYTEVGKFYLTPANLGTLDQAPDKKNPGANVTTVMSFAETEATHVKVLLDYGSNAKILGTAPADNKIFWEFGCVSQFDVSSGKTVSVPEEVIVDGKLDEPTWANTDMVVLNGWIGKATADTLLPTGGKAVIYGVRSDANNVYIAVKAAREWTDVPADLPLSGADTTEGKAEVDAAVTKGSRIRLWVGKADNSVGFFDIIRQNGTVKTFFGKVATSNITVAIDGDTVEIKLPKTGGSIELGDVAKLNVNYSDVCFGDTGDQYNQLHSSSDPGNAWKEATAYPAYTLADIVLGKTTIAKDPETDPQVLADLTDISTATTTNCTVTKNEDGSITIKKTDAAQTATAELALTDVTVPLTLTSNLYAVVESNTALDKTDILVAYTCRNGVGTDDNSKSTSLYFTNCFGDSAVKKDKTADKAFGIFDLGEYLQSRGRVNSTGTIPLSKITVNLDAATDNLILYTVALTNYVPENDVLSDNYAGLTAKPAPDDPSDTTTEEPSDTTTEEPSDTTTEEPSDTTTEEPSDTTTEEPSDTTSDTPSGPVVMTETIEVDGKLDDLGWTSKNAQFAEMTVTNTDKIVKYAVRSDADGNAYIAIQLPQDWADIPADLPLATAADVDAAVTKGSRIRLWVENTDPNVNSGKPLFFDIVRQNGEVKTFFLKAATANINVAIDGSTLEIKLPKTGDVTLGDKAKLAINYSDCCFGEGDKAYQQAFSVEKPWEGKNYTEYDLKALALGEVTVGEESSEATSSETPSTADSSAATSSQGKPGAGDAGIIVFALIGVIALAGAVVAIRVRR